MADNHERQLLAIRQAALLDAMTADAPIPEGFDQARVTLAGEALWRKRARGIAKSWPQLTASLASGFSDLVEQYSSKFPTPPPGGPLADGYDFVLFLRSIGRLEDTALREFTAIQLRLKRTESGFGRRRGPAARFQRLASGTLVALQFVQGTEWWFRLPL